MCQHFIYDKLGLRVAQSNPVVQHSETVLGPFKCHFSTSENNYQIIHKNID